VGPEAAWADEQRAGCNYLRMHSVDGRPVAPNTPLLAPTAEALMRLREDIASVRGADLVVVALHKGIVHTPAVLAPYERPLAEAALDAGADVVVGHHAHILRGLERRSGRALFHGLGNGCVVTRALSPSQQHPARAAWARKRRELFGFEPDPRYELAPFHPEAVHGALGVVRQEADGQLRMGVIPVLVEPPGRPVCVSDARAPDVITYLDRIGALAGLPALQWRREGEWLWWCV
jgi:poly-gamma-glutamate synthesis protein (capsule biosynthesis protein)